MGKIVLLLSKEEMLYQAHNILQGGEFKIDEMRVIATDAAVTEARRSISEGATIIIARGLQASIIKQYTTVPVVEITMTAQEIALLIMRAKEIINKQRPVIAVVGFQNMFCDMSYFDELYGVELKTYFAKQGNELGIAAQQAVDDKVDLIIGGDLAVKTATEAGLPCLFLSTTGESLRQAFHLAERMDYAMNLEKKSAAQMETLLDYSYSGVIRLDGEGKILDVNSVMEDMILQQEEALKGKYILEIAPKMDPKVIEKVLKEGKEQSFLMDWNDIPTFVTMAPVFYDHSVDGVVITCHKTRNTVRECKKKNFLSGRQFEDLVQESQIMKECITKARLYALSEQPVVFVGEAGTERRMLAECIHNDSRRRNGPFLDIPCEGLTDQEQWTMIFGENGAALASQGGTLLLQDVESLSSANQYRLYQMIRFHVYYGVNVGSLRKLDVRAMVTSSQPLHELVEQNKIRKDLYYLLSGLELLVPPLRERKEDLEKILTDSFRTCCERYSRYHVLTQGAKKSLLEYPWSGNLFQIDSFMERFVLTAPKRSLGEVEVAKLINELYPKEIEKYQQEKVLPEVSCLCHTAFVQNEESNRIIKELQRFSGNRGKTAAELGISKTTLWRYMKKYGIE